MAGQPSDRGGGGHALEGLVARAAGRCQCPLHRLRGEPLGEDEGDGERDNFVLTPDGTILVVTAPDDDASGLVRRPLLGADSVIVLGNATLDMKRIDGIGANPHMKAAGVAAFQVAFSREVSPGVFDEDGLPTAIYTGIPGSITLIARTFDVLTGGETVAPSSPIP